MISSIYQLTLLINTIVTDGKYLVGPMVEDYLLSIYINVLFVYLQAMIKEDDYSLAMVDQITAHLDDTPSLLSIMDSAEEFEDKFAKFPATQQTIKAVEDHMYLLSSDIATSGKRALTKQTVAKLESFVIPENAARQIAINASAIIAELLYFAKNRLEREGGAKFISMKEINYVLANDEGAFSKFEI